MAASRQFGLALQTAFIDESCSTLMREVDQFQALIRAFAALQPEYLVKELHGTRHQVQFATSSPWLRRSARCELCDVMFVVYSLADGLSVRMTFLQAKLSRQTYPQLQNPSLHPVTVSFPANFEQWDLLSHRPVIKGAGRFEPPLDLLRSAVSPSIGSFGVFYLDHSGDVDMFYCSADTLLPIGTPTTKTGRLTTSVLPAVTRRLMGHDDVYFCPDTLRFGIALYEMKIGSPVVTTGPDGKQHRSEPLTSWLVGTLQAHEQINATAGEPLQTLLDSLGRTDVAPKPSPLPGSHLVLLRAE